MRARTIDGKQIDIEIQILPVIHMPARTLYYWSKMYAGQMKSGYDYDSLKKCITINIVDFKCLKIKKLHTVYHLSEDEAGGHLTDLMEVHFLELSKLNNPEVEQDPKSPVVLWLKFFAAKSRSAMEMLAKDNEDINKAYENLKKISQDEKTRMAYEARDAWLIDERSRIKEARENASTTN